MPDTESIHTYKLCAGSNLENAETILSNALDLLCAKFECIAQTPIKKTTAIGTNSCTYFLNVGISVKTKLQPTEFKEILNKIECDFGRIKNSTRVALDIDIIAKDETIIHPDYKQREYVRELMKELDEMETNIHK